MALALGLWLHSVPAAAQVATGGLRGFIRDETGAALAGVTVTVSGPALPGSSRTDVSTPLGLYRFEALPVGLYKVTFGLTGFRTGELGDARVEVGRSIEHDVTLRVGQVLETVTVSGARPVVDASHAGSSTVFNQQLLENIPTSRASFFDSITFAPAVKTDQTVNIAVFNIFGSSVDQNTFQYQGVDISAPSFGSPWDFPNFDIMGELEVRAIGAPAEYTGFQGGVVNLVTKSGTNTRSGTIGYFFTEHALVGNNTPDEAFPFNIDYQRELSLELGGPLIKDRLWAFGILNFFRNRVSDVGVDPIYAPVQRRVRPYVKINASLGPRDSIELMFNDNNFNSPNPASRTTPPETTLVEHGHNPVIVGRWLRIVNATTLFEVKGGGIYIRDRLDPYSDDFVTPGRFDYADGTSHDNAGYTWRDVENKTSIDASMSRHIAQWLGGAHNLKTGLQWQRSSVTTNDAYLQNVFYYDFAGEPYQRETHEASGTGGRVVRWGAFLQDDFAATARLTLNLGVRIDRTTAGVPEVAQYDHTSTVPTGVVFPALPNLIAYTDIAPRLGVAFRVDEDARTVAKAHYGRYHGKLNTNMFSAVSPGNTSFDGYDFNPVTGQYDIPSYSVASGTAVSVDPQLGSQYTDQFSVGIERQLRPDFGIDVSFVYKRDAGAIRQEDRGGIYEPVPLVDPFDGRTITIYNRTPTSESAYVLTNRDELSSRYRSVIVQAYKRWAGVWQLHASYVWQRAEGAASGELGVSSQDFSSFGDNKLFGRDPNDLINATGRLPTDSTHGVRISSTYQAPLGFQFAVRYSGESGRPYGRIIDALDLNQGVRPILAEPRAAYHLPALNDLQVRVTKDFDLGGAKRLRVSMDVFNLFNADTALTVRNNSSEAGDDFGQTLSVFAPRRAMVGVRFLY